MNPHNWMEALDPPGRSNRRWRCHYCRAEGTVDDLLAVACTHVYPPCESCGQTPTCAADCAGISEALSAPGGFTAGWAAIAHHIRGGERRIRTPAPLWRRTG